MTGGSIEAKVVKTRYYLENIPALKPESYITTMQDYYSKLSLQLQSVKYPNSPFQDVTTNWKSVAKDLLASQTFGEQINNKRYTKNLMAAVKPKLENAQTEMEKVAAIYRYLSLNINWNEFYGRSSNSLDAAFSSKSATSGELNMMLLALCKQVGIEAFPILISTRSHGKMMKYYPKTDQFNHVIALVIVDDKQLLLDVGSPNRDPDLLRLSSLNYSGWLVDKENAQWINIPMPSDTEIMMATLDLDENGNLSGTINRSFKGYCAMTNRSAFHRNREEDHKNIHEEWQEVFPDISIKTISFENEKNTTKNLKCKLDIEIPQAAQVNGDFIYLSPMVGLSLDENPLKQETRTFPVDMPLKYKHHYILNLAVPEGYTIDELPEAINMKTEGDGASFQFLVSQQGNKVQVVSKVTINQIKYLPEEYATIKNFFDLIVEKQGEQIVLKKNT